MEDKGLTSNSSAGDLISTSIVKGKISVTASWVQPFLTLVLIFALTNQLEKSFDFAIFFL